MTPEERVSFRVLAVIKRVPDFFRTVLCGFLGTGLVVASFRGGWWGIGALVVMFGLLYFTLDIAEGAVDEAEAERRRRDG